MLVVARTRMLGINVLHSKQRFDLPRTRSFRNARLFKKVWARW